ncbi:MAG: replication initiator protein A [Sarcina sp.]
MENEDNKLIKKDRSLKERSFIMDINMIEAPLCQYRNKRTKYTARELEESENISSEMKYVLSTMPEESKSSQVEFLSWTDSKGIDREILAASIFNLPNAFAMDVFHALVGLYIRKNSPITYSEEEKIYNMPENKLEFRIYELCDFMRISYGGTMYRKIKSAIRELASVKYYSLANGIFYNKKKEKYESSREKSISLISDYDFFQKGKDKSTEKCEVMFGNLVMENMKYSYIKFLNDAVYFTIPSGITRRLYSYIEGNRYNKNYIKRGFEVLKYKIPIDFKYPSELKKRLKIPLSNLIEAGVIKDFFYGDEIKINNTKEPTIYIIFEGTRKELIDSLTEKPRNSKLEKKNELESDYKLEFPKDIKQELLGFNINSVKVMELIKKYSKWKLAEYILWMKDGIKKGKVKDPAGLFVFAITDEMVKVENTHPDIVEFVEKIKSEVEGKNKVTKELIDKAYKEYIEQELKVFEEDDEFAFVASKESILKDIEKVQKKKIKSQRQLYNMATTQEEKDKLLATIEKWEKFTVEKDKSDIFIDMFVKKTKLYRGLMEYEEFKQKYIDENMK